MFWDKLFQKKEKEIPPEPLPNNMILEAAEETDDTDEIYDSTEQLISEAEDPKFRILYERVVVHTEQNIDSCR